MAVLISPSNNSGWGLGLRSMYGGAKTKSAQHPVFVHAHYRASWGSQTGRRRRTARAARRAAAAAMDAVTAAQVDAVIDDVARNGPPATRSAVVVSAPRRSGRYSLRTSRRLTPAGLALARRIARRAVRGSARRRRRRR
uniref:PVII protein n=1 Tax=Cardioderma bat adenovirus TaxID=3141913 RepID=A0AAU7DZ76_9ADEN